MATHSGVLAWRIPGMAEPGGLPSIGSHRDGHDWSDLAAAPAAAAKTFKPTSEDHFTEMLEKIFLHGWHEWHIRIYLTKILWMGQNDIRRDDLYLWASQSSESYLDSSDVQSCVCVCVCVCVLVTLSCLTLCDSMDYFLPGSSVHGFTQARILEWVAFSFSRRSSQSRDWTWASCIAGRFFTIWSTREDNLMCYGTMQLYIKQKLLVNRFSVQLA